MQLSRHSVHRALTRPQMFAGVTLNYFVINAVVTMEAFLIFKTFWILPIPIIMHVIGYFACSARAAHFRSVAYEGQQMSASAELQALGLQQLHCLSPFL